MVQSAVSHRVLVVADEPGAAEVLRALLELWGHDVLAAADPAIAVALAGTLRPAVVVLDVARPGAHGLAVARRLRELPWGTAPAVVAAAGPDERAVRLRAWEAGCTHFLPTPLDPTALRGVLSVPPHPRRGSESTRASGRA